MGSPFADLHPDVAAWCEKRLRKATPPQARAIPLGIRRRNLLLCSPTGTGKTLAAFLPVISSLAAKRDADELLARTYALYVSPLRALGYDVEHNLRRPMREMGLLERPDTERQRVRRGRVRERYARTGVRTGDTPPEERRLMLVRPPHVLITTPESLAVMLAMDAYRKTLRLVETVIVDEVHALAGNKRGAQLALLLETLEELAPGGFNRIGLSATISPLERAANWLAGEGRECDVIDERRLRTINIGIDVPFTGAIATLPTVAQRAGKFVGEGSTALIFTNVRSQAERVAHEMSRDFPDPDGVELANASGKGDARVGVHHSALERSVRHRVEAALREGKLQAVVCSSSLELGIDIGYVDRVLVIGGARGITATLQRVGRAGHRPDAVADGVVIAQDRDDIIEAAATKRCIADGVLEQLEPPEAPLDVLAQWLMMSVCYDRRVSIDDALRIARRALPFRSVSRHDVISCARYLSGAGVGPDTAHVSRIGFDGAAIYGLGREVCAAYFDNVGTIPDQSGVLVRSGGADLGRLEESFVNALRVGDVFLLNGRTLRVKEIGRRGVSAEAFTGRPTVPQWSSHLKGVAPALATEISRLRVGVAERLRTGSSGAALDFLRTRYGLRGEPAAHVLRYIAQQCAISAVPGERSPVIELYRMDGRQVAVFHTGAGRRVNETLARIVGTRVFAHARANTQLTTDDGGFMVTLPPRKRLPDEVWARILYPNNFDQDLLAGLRGSHMLQNFFRYVANTGLLVLRRAGGRTLRRGTQRWNSARILERVMSADPDFPLLRETVRAVTRDLLDAPSARRYVESIDGLPRVIHPPAASPFTFGILTSSFGDSVMMDERATMVEALHARVLQLVGESEDQGIPLRSGANCYLAARDTLALRSQT